MTSGDLDQLVKHYLEDRFGAALEYFVIEGHMTPDINGDIGVTGDYRKKAGDKTVFFTATVNLALSTIKNLQEYP